MLPDLPPPAPQSTAAAATGPPEVAHPKPPTADADLAQQGQPVPQPSAQPRNIEAQQQQPAKPQFFVEKVDLDIMSDDEEIFGVVSGSSDEYEDDDD